ncbi:C6 zinc finger domain protein [Cladophialophora carrionii]|uniref:C6 zinc finger domain protein n=1 Tax=Cladophialophora carrionii TaxID=86049 RepID=A0A1C1CRV3_9EURO|nr:C6 zinc finger domain protein [Cladophialophora carrionii]
MAAVLPQRAALAEPTAAGYSKTSRRQYQACDQCRKSRRACDAGTLRVANFPFREEEQPDASAATCEACSNCARTSKRCTFVWLSKLSLQGLPKGVKRKLESTGLPNLVADAAPDSTYQTSSYPGDYSISESSALPQLLPATHSFHTVHDTPPNGLPKYHITPIYASPEQTVNYPSTSPEARYSIDSNAHQVAPSIATASADGGVVTSIQSIPDVAFRPPRLPDETTNHIRWSPPNLGRHDTTSTSSGSNSIESITTVSKVEPSPSLTSISSEPSGDDGATPAYCSKRVKGGSVPAEYYDTLVTHQTAANSRPRRQPNIAGVSPSFKRQNSTVLSNRQVHFIDTAMKKMIATGLLQIYHDSFENSLSCWVTERNCPYEIELRGLSPNTSPASTAEEAAVRLGDNRILSRVSRLDAAFARLRERELSVIENRTATNALNAAIMAFASQWSHSSHNAFWRSREGMSQMRACQSQSQGLFSQSEWTNNERHIQKMLWHDARTAIQASAEIDSFKVILAYMIFALTQRPIDVKTKTTPETQTSPTDSATDSRNGLETPSTDDGTEPRADPAMETIVDKEWNPFYASEPEALASPPIYLETAVRNLFSWRRKIERYRRLRSKNKGAHGHGSMGPLAVKDHQTFNLLFWLGVMCDTTSSAISKRPLVISDEDCAMIQENVDAAGDSPEGEESHYQQFDKDRPDDSGSLWGNYLLKFTCVPDGCPPLRWPCSFDEAASVLQEAIPVKVLMFRKVAALQTLAYRRSSPHQLERCIKEALDVYSHWNNLYGQFMIDCVDQHNILPPHVKSWYVILDGHWHYGCLLLAETILQVDKEGKTLEPQRNLRASCELLRELRQSNAVAIAKIAQASLSEHIPSVPDNAEFHFATNSSAILTEPWTDILVRAMGSACKIFIDWLSAWHNSADTNHVWVHTTNSYENLYSQAEACIQAMTLLGRKSDAAKCTAEAFWTRLSRATSYRRASAGTDKEDWSPETSSRRNDQ